MHRLTLTLLLFGFAPAWATTDVRSDPDTGLVTWQTQAHGAELRLTQIGPDQARAFYQARGFSPDAVEHYVAECVFMTVVRNVGDAAIAHRLSDWRYVQTGEAPRRVRSKAEWGRLWERLGVDESARLAFTWAQFPATQTFEPGDWNQGMTTYRVARDDPFDVQVRWRSAGRTHSAILENVRCAT